MPGDVADPTAVAARRALLDGLDALGPHAPLVVLVGAQAVYVHTEAVVTGIALFTKDADLMLIPPVASVPDIERAMGDAGLIDALRASSMADTDWGRPTSPGTPPVARPPPTPAVRSRTGRQGSPGCRARGRRRARSPAGGGPG